MKLRVFPKILQLIPTSHSALPSIKKTTSISYKFQFEKWEYDIGTDQSDWNKLTGLKSKFFKPLDEAYMVVWRWYKGSVQLAFYSNLDGGFTLPKEEDIITLPTPDTPFKVNIKVFEKDLMGTIKVDDGQLLVYNTPFRDKPKWEISFWFGGNRLPDRLIVCNRWKL